MIDTLFRLSAFVPSSKVTAVWVVTAEQCLDVLDTLAPLRECGEVVIKVRRATGRDRSRAHQLSQDTAAPVAAPQVDAWGRPIMQPGDGHSAWSCNNYECTEHPASLYPSFTQ